MQFNCWTILLVQKKENKETYRVGTLILHQEGRSTYNIVDGQQRTITFSLLLKALGVTSIRFLEQPLANNPHNTRNIPNNFRTLERRTVNIDVRERGELLDYIEKQLRTHCCRYREHIRSLPVFLIRKMLVVKKLYPP
ncbi:DUF262 domain-containing protein [Candidatus Accumulibacter contiguus]|uniref:DUF262 domain-containing protein n=1 Tax=Candidatus Accumulibacter contiguus TaxID=2954381 RepID=UPI00207B9CB9|nr:DUF262 domain-containing protein [Candidatus Accumulibacter contiguus]